jgi:hypothetical protein
MAQRGDSVRYLLDGPSARLLRECGLGNRLIQPLPPAAAGRQAVERIVRDECPELILLGSSPARNDGPDTPEQFAILIGRELAIPTLGVLDYWGMYRERFTGPEGQFDLGLVPDTLCVLDELCRDDLTALGIPRHRMVVTHNPWLDQVVAIAERLTQAWTPENRTVVFASQPLAENASVRGWSMTQNDIFEVLVECARRSGDPWQLEVWPHAAETPGRWPDEWPEQRGHVQIRTRRSGTLGDLARAVALVTSHSTIAHEALHLGVPCVSLRLDKRREAAYMIDRVHLSRTAESPAELQQCLAEVASGAAHARLAERRDELAAQGAFFSDGGATQRVLSEVDRLLDMRHDA